VTFNGPLTGTGTLTIVGGTVNLNCANALPLTVVGQGTLVIGGSITGPVTTQGSGTVQNSANNKLWRPVRLMRNLTGSIRKRKGLRPMTPRPTDDSVHLLSSAWSR